MRFQNPRLWLETELALISGLLLLLTLFWRDWIEAIFGVDPDAHNGSFEWLVVASLLVLTSIFVKLAHATWRDTAKPG